jgi:hypothetical protein
MGGAADRNVFAQVDCSVYEVRVEHSFELAAKPLEERPSCRWLKSRAASMESTRHPQEGNDSLRSDAAANDTLQVTVETSTPTDALRHFFPLSTGVIPIYRSLDSIFKYQKNRGSSTHWSTRMNTRSCTAMLRSIVFGGGAMLAAATVYAAPSSFPTSGVCGFAGTMSYPFVYQYGFNAGPDWGVTLLGTLDWGAKTAAINVMQINPLGPQSTEHQVQFSGPFTLNAGPIPQSAQLTITFPGGGSFAMNALSVSKGTSILLQSGPGPVGGADGGFVAECKF